MKATLRRVSSGWANSGARPVPSHAKAQARRHGCVGGRRRTRQAWWPLPPRSPSASDGRARSPPRAWPPAPASPARVSRHPGPPHTCYTLGCLHAPGSEARAAVSPLQTRSAAPRGTGGTYGGARGKGSAARSVQREVVTGRVASTREVEQQLEVLARGARARQAACAAGVTMKPAESASLFSNACGGLVRAREPRACHQVHLDSGDYPPSPVTAVRASTKVNIAQRVSAPRCAQVKADGHREENGWCIACSHPQL